MIRLKTSDQIQVLAASGVILASVMKAITREVKEGVRLSDLDKMAEELMRKSGAEPAFLNYKPGGADRPYPASICTSLNDVVVHGLPSSRKVKSGDLLKLDFGVKYQGFYTDAAVTIPIGEVSDEAKRLMKATKRALEKAIGIARPGKTTGDIGFEIEKVAKAFGFKPVRGLTGHGVGFAVHEEPTIYNYGEKGKGKKLEPGMVIAIEPMFSAGDDEIRQLKDESWATKDGSLAAQFEHTVAITKTGARILTG